jgi:hypothetical protein
MVRAGVRPDISERVLGQSSPAWKEFTTGTRISTRSARRWMVERIFSPALADIVPLDERRQRVQP